MRTALSFGGFGVGNRRNPSDAQLLGLIARKYFMAEDRMEPQKTGVFVIPAPHDLASVGSPKFSDLAGRRLRGYIGVE